MKHTFSDTDIFRYLTHHLSPEEITDMDHHIRTSPELQQRVEDMRQILPVLLAARDEERLRMMKTWDQQQHQKDQERHSGCGWIFFGFCFVMIAVCIGALVYRYDPHRMATAGLKDIRMSETGQGAVPSAAWDSVMWWMENKQYPESVLLMESYKEKLRTEDQWIAEATILMIKLGQAGPTETWDHDARQWLLNQPATRSTPLKEVRKKLQEPWYRIFYAPFRKICVYPVRTGIM